MITAHDAPGTTMVFAAGIDILLVGDSLAMTVHGYPTTLPITMEEMLFHAKAVRGRNQLVNSF